MLIQVAELNPPKDGKKVAHIFTMTGLKFEVWPDKLASFHVGEQYDVDVSEREWNNKTLRRIEKFKPAKRGPQRATPEPPPQSAAPEADTSESERLFVCSTVNAFIAAGKVTPDQESLYQATIVARRVWQRAFNSSVRDH